MQYQDFKRQAGWTTATDRKLRQGIVQLDRVRRRIIHTGSGNTQDIPNLEERAKAMSLSLPDDKTNKLGDSVARASSLPVEMSHKLDGSDVDIPMTSQLDIRSAGGITFLGALDAMIVTMTRLDSREASHRIVPEEAIQMFSCLEELWSICDEYGGDDNIVGITEGVLPSEEPQGAARSSAIRGGDEAAVRAEES